MNISQYSTGGDNMKETHKRGQSTIWNYFRTATGQRRKAVGNQRRQE